METSGHAIASRGWSSEPQPPDETQLKADLARLLRIYDDAIETKRSLLISSPGTISSRGSPSVSPGKGFADFKPKNADDYRATIKAREVVKSRRHERLVADFGEHARARKFTPTTEHPLDLVLRNETDTYLVEVKVLYQGNATDAVRSALGQLLAYSYFLYEPTESPRLIALFSEPVGSAFEQFLAKLNVLAIWWDAGRWQGTDAARKTRLVD